MRQVPTTEPRNVYYFKTDLAKFVLELIVQLKFPTSSKLTKFYEP